MKKVLSIICSVTILLASISFVFPAFAEAGSSIDTVVEELCELYQEEAESGKELEESAECRIIVKASRKPDTYGNAQLVKGTDKIYIYQYSDITSANSALEYYNSLSYVSWAEADGIMESQSLSYGNDMMGSDEAKEYIINNNIPTDEVNVAVIDGGINFNLNRFTETGRVIDSGFNSSNTGSENSAQQDGGNYHGSNITSIILDNTTENVNVIGYKVMNSEGKGTNLSVASGIEKATDDDVDVINLSLGGEGSSQLIVDAVNEAVSSGITVICAAGNEADDVMNYCPANIESAITVGAVDNNGNIACFSNFGKEVDFVAPGYNVEVWGNKALNSAKPDYASGTSFSAPFVASAAAIVLSVNPNYSPNEVKSELIKSCISKEEINYSSSYLKAIDISIDNMRGLSIKEIPHTESLYYGYGLPQMQEIIGIDEKCSSPLFSLSSGIYNDEFQLEITADENAEIYYTTDGSYPSSNSISYSEPITISETASVRAIAYKDGKVKSVPSAQEYKIEYLADEADFIIDERGYITKYTGTGKNGNYIEIKVPDTINGIEVKGVAENAFLDTAEKEEIEEFGEYDTHLKGITLPETVTEIEDYSFENLYSLQYFSAPGLKTVGDYALDAPIVYLDAPNIESIGISGLSTNLSEINLPKLTYADDSAFSENQYLTNVNLPMLKEGGTNIFRNCSRLINVNLEQVTILGDNAFEYCSWLKNIKLYNLEEIKSDLINGMFYNCTSLNEIYLPKLKGVLPKHCFDNCRNINTIYIPNVEIIEENALNLCPYIEVLYIPSVKEIYSNSFIVNGIVFAPKLETAISVPNTGEIMLFYENITTPVLYLSNSIKDLPISQCLYNIIAPTDSYAQQWANENNCTFIPSDSRDKNIENPANVTDLGRSICTYYSGLRFGFEWNEIPEIEELASNIEYGFIYSQKGIEDLTFDTVDNSNIRIAKAQNRVKNGNITSFNLVFADIPDSYIDKTLSARAYVCIDGMYFYSNVSTGSYTEVANLVLNDNEIDINTKNAINNLLSKEV